MSSLLHSGLIISGGIGSVGNSVEVFVPSTGHHCRLPDTQWQHNQHSMEKNVICGGHHPAWYYCQTLTNGIWEFTTTLLEKRFYLNIRNTCLDHYNYQVSSHQLGLTFRNDFTRRRLQSQHNRENRRGRDFQLQLRIKI